MAKILFVMTGSDHWTLADGSLHPTGFWAEEAVAPYERFKAAGYEIVVATPGGVVPTVDRGSLAPEFNDGQENADRVASVLASMSELQQPLDLADVDPADYAAVFYPGGHGPMEDLAVNSDSGRLLISALESGLPLGIVCHAPAAVLAATKDDGTNAFALLPAHRLHQHGGEPGRIRGQGRVAAPGPPGGDRHRFPGGRAVGPVRGRRPQSGHRPEPRLRRPARGRAAQEARLIRRAYRAGTRTGNSARRN